MGQYHALYNKTKKELVYGSELGMGAKAKEHTGFPGSMSDALYLLLSNSMGRGGGDYEAHPCMGRWAGDQVVVEGDYAEPGDPGFVENTDGYTNIGPTVRHMMEALFPENYAQRRWGEG